MKNVWTCFIMGVLLTPVLQKQTYHDQPHKPLPVSKNLVFVTIDGFRWQELFTGADSALIHSSKYTPDPETLQSQYWDQHPERRRERLMPFFWNVIAQRGQVYGNRNYNNKVNVANLYSLSYPGYSEMFTGNTDISISSNNKRNNPNINVWEYLNSLPAFSGKVSVFSSWDVFPYILNTDRSHLRVNSGYDPLNELTATDQVINAVQRDAVYEKKSTRYDQLTFLAAKEYLQEKKPRVLFLGLGETDEFAHESRYDLYLQQASQVDRMLGELWHWIQTTPGYKDNTTLIITTDHGRGGRSGNWNKHGEFISGSSQTWFAMLGPGLAPAGEIKTNEQFYNQQLAQTVASVLGEEFTQAEAPVVAIH